MNELTAVQTQRGQPILVPASLAKIFSEFEPLSLRYFSESVSEGQTVVDVGANFGYYTAIASNLVGPSGRVFSFEPSPETVQILQMNIKTLLNVQHIPKAVSDISGTLNFFHTRDFVNSGTVENPPFQDSADLTTLEVQATTLDNFFGDDKQVDFLKIDIQGDDIKALRGAKDLIRRSKKIKVLVEWAPTWMGNAGYDAEDLPRCLSDLGLDDMIVLDDWLEKEIEIDEFLQIIADDETGKRFANIFARKKM